MRRASRMSCGTFTRLPPAGLVRSVELAHGGRRSSPDVLGELEEALEAMRKTDPELHAIVALEGGALRVPTHEGVSVLALSDRAYMALVHLAIPERQDVHALRGRWFAA